MRQFGVGTITDAEPLPDNGDCLIALGPGHWVGTLMYAGTPPRGLAAVVARIRSLITEVNQHVRSLTSPCGP